MVVILSKGRVKEGRGCSFSEIVSQIIPRGGTKECGWGGLRITIVGIVTRELHVHPGQVIA